MKTKTTAILAAVLAATGSISAIDAAQAGVTDRQIYDEIARSAFADAEDAMKTTGTTYYIDASLARTAASTFGWNDWRVRKYINRVVAAQHADGGWGPDKVAVDAFGDGTYNPRVTTYTISTTDHVGPLLTMAYKRGMVSRSTVLKAVNSVMTTPRVTTGPGRECISYSRSSYDRVTATNGKCVSNVNISAAWFLKATADMGVEVPGQRAVAARLLADDVARRLPNNTWPYRQGLRTSQDTDHAGVNAELYPAMGAWPHQNAVRAQVAQPLTADKTDYLGKLRILPYAKDKCSAYTDYAIDMYGSIPSMTYYRGAGFDYVRTTRYAQLAMWGSRAAAVC